VKYRLKAAQFAHSYFRKLSLSHPQSDTFLSCKSVLDVAEWALSERDWPTMSASLRAVRGESGMGLTHDPRELARLRAASPWDRSRVTSGRISVLLASGNLVLSSR
jgi:hypothetical protein